MNESGKLHLTSDGSHTVFSSRFGEFYHSVHGAIAESEHVFINAGLNYRYSRMSDSSKGLEVLEVGFGTGLNALLSLIWAEANKVQIRYTGVEPYPLSRVLIEKINYPARLGDTTLCNSLSKMHDCFTVTGVQTVQISPHFQFSAQLLQFAEFTDKNGFDVLYFDAFSPDKQPEMWTPPVFSKVFHHLLPAGVLTTYCAKGRVRRGLQSAGFEMERIPGPAHKREILRAISPLKMSQAKPN